MGKANIAVPGFPNVSVAPWTQRPGDTYGIRYCGTAEDLIASGAVTADMIASGRRGKRDSDGDRYTRKVYYRRRAGRPELCYRVIRWKLKAMIRRLPGGSEALVEGEREHAESIARFDAMSRFVAWEAAEGARRGGPGTIAAPATQRPAKSHKKRPAYLRLVVDNTRGARP